ncbi:MAG: choice-of-anchor U domain-containing protein [Thermodesulfobacteriota bacterium]
MKGKIGFVIAVALAFLMVTAGAALAANQQKVADAIHGGQQWLVNAQAPDGGWTDNNWGVRNTATAFALAALLETNGVPYTSTVITNGIAFLMAHATDLGGGVWRLGDGDGHQNYSHNACLLALALYAAQAGSVSPTLTAMIEGAKQFTLSYQTTNPANNYYGSWGYDTGDKNYSGDNSNTQFAVMGLWYADRFLQNNPANEDWATYNYAWLQHTFASQGNDPLGNPMGMFQYYPGYTWDAAMTGSGLWQIAMIGKADDDMAKAVANWFGYTPNYNWAITPPSNSTCNYYYFIYAMAKALTATVGAQNLLGPEQRPWTTDLVNEMVDNKAIWDPAPVNPGEYTPVHWQGQYCLDGGNTLATAWVLMAIAFVDPNIEKKEAFLPDPPVVDFPIRGLITLSTTGNVTIQRAQRRRLGPERFAQNVTLPVGATEFTLNNVTVGGCTVLNILLPPEAMNPANLNSFVNADGTLKAGINWFKIRNGEWKGQGNIPIIVDKVAGVIKVTLCDGGPGDEDGVANGKIVDPGAPGFGAAAPAPAPGPTDQAASKSDSPFGCFIDTLLH